MGLLDTLHGKKHYAFKREGGLCFADPGFVDPRTGNVPGTPGLGTHFVIRTLIAGLHR